MYIRPFQVVGHMIRWLFAYIHCRSWLFPPNHGLRNRAAAHMAWHETIVGSDLEAFHLFEMYSESEIYVTDMYLHWQLLLVHLFFPCDLLKAVNWSWSPDPPTLNFIGITYTHTHTYPTTLLENGLPTSTCGAATGRGGAARLDKMEGVSGGQNRSTASTDQCQVPWNTVDGSEIRLTSWYDKYP